MKRKVLLYVILLVIGLAVFYFLSKKIVIVAANCSSQKGSCSADIEETVNSQVGKNYFKVRSELTKSLDENSKIESYDLHFVFPSTISLEIVEKEPVTAVAFTPERIFLFDREGNVLGEVKETALPTLRVVEAMDDKSVKFAAQLFRDLNKYYKVSTGELTQFGLKANLNGVEVVFPLTGDIDVILGSLEVVLLQASTGKNYAIDLRYKNPVIKER